MRKICLLVAAFALLLSCSKKNNVTPANNSVKIDGTDYPTVTIGNQVWTTVNYSGAGGYHSADHAYGDYYTQSQALAINLPTGWRVPTMSDYNILLGNFTTAKDPQGNFDLVANNVATLLSTSGWPTTGTNVSGFNAQPGGLFAIQPQPPIFESDGAAGYYMTSDAGGQLSRFGFLVSPLGANIGASSTGGLSYSAYSLRFVRTK